MSVLPRQNTPVSLQRFQPGHLPKHRERRAVGRTNRLEHLAETHAAMERTFVPQATSVGPDRNHHRQAATVSVGQAYTLSGYRSARGQAQDVQAVRTLVNTLRAAGTTSVPTSTPTKALATSGKAQPACLGRGGFQPPISQPPSPPEAHLEAVQAQLEADMHPTVAGMVCAQRYGTGHTISAENFFLRRGGHDADYDTAMPGSTSRVGQRQFSTYQTMPLLRNRHVPARSEGGGTLEYADPLTDAYAHNRSVARFDVRQLRAATAATEAKREAVPTAMGDSHTGCVEAPGEAYALKGPSTHAAAACASPLPSQDAWLASYTPSARPYEVQPFLGRCGYSDFRSTHHRIQAQPESDMYASPCQYQSTYTKPLETPNQWQLRNAKTAEANWGN